MSEPAGHQGAPSTRHGLDDDRGFTLIELLVSLLAVAVLIAFAIPLFQGVQDRARDEAVQTHLRDGLTLERAHWQETGAYTALPTSLSTYDPLANFYAVPDLVDHPMLILDLTSSGQRVCLAALSDSGTWFGIFSDASTGKTYYGDGMPVPCDVSLAAAYEEGGW